MAFEIGGLNGRRLRRASLLAALAAGALAAPLACSSSDEKKGSTIGGDGGGSGSGSADSGSGGSGADGNGGSAGLFGGDSGSFFDSGRPNGPDGSCGQSPFAASSKKVNMLLVIDESGSMTKTPTGFGTDKWTAMKSSLDTALTATQTAIHYGLELFPHSADPTTPIPLQCSDNCCEMPAAPGIDVPIEVGSSGVSKIKTALGATSPGGGTPTALALERALAYFTTGAGKALEGDKYVLLATDGGPNCNADVTQCSAAACTTNIDGICPATGADGGSPNCCDPATFGDTTATSKCLDDGGTLAQVTALADAGIKTFVVGIPGSEAYESTLEALATAGGVPATTGATKYFAVAASGGAAGLTDVLQSITKTLIKSCELQLDSNPPDLDKLNVNVDGVSIPQAGPDGWGINTTTSPPTVVLKGKTCTDVETKGAESVQVVYGCPTIITR